MNGSKDKKPIYCISGLGADARLFSNLEISGTFGLKPVAWIPARSGETIESYAERMAAVITDQNPILLGVSFGGMIAVEMAKFMPIKKIFLVSSIKTRFEKPFYFRMGAFLRLNKLISLKPTKFLEPFENFNLGVKTAEDKELAEDYHRHFDEKFGDWAIDRIIHWKNEVYPPNLTHIHGSKDHILPIRYVKPDFIVEGGGHLMIFNHAEEVSAILNRVLANENL